MKELKCAHVPNVYSLYVSTKLRLDDYKLVGTKQLRINTVTKMTKKTMSVEDALKEKFVTYDEVKDYPLDIDIEIEMEEEVEMYTEIIENRFVERMSKIASRQKNVLYELAKAAELPHEYMISLTSSYDGDFHNYLDNRLTRGKLYDADNSPSAIVFLKTDSKVLLNNNYTVTIVDSFFVSKIEGDVYYLLNTKGENVKMTIDDQVLKKGIVRNFVLFFPETVHITVVNH